MRRLAIVLGIVLASAAARADQPLLAPIDAKGNAIYHLPAPSGANAATQPLLFGAHPATSILANPTGSTGNAVDLSCTTSGTFLGNSGASLACILVPSTSVSGLDYQLVLNQGGSPLTAQPKLNFGVGLLAVNNSGASRTDVTNDFATGLSGGQTAFGGTGAGEALTLQGTTNATPGPVKVVAGTSGGQGLRILRASDGLEAGEFLPYLGGSSGPLGLKLDAIFSAPMVTTNELVNNDGQLTITSSLDGPTGSAGITVNSAFGNGDSTGYQLLVVPGASQLSSPFGVLTTGGALAFQLTPAGAANFLGPMTVGSLVGPGFVKASSAGLFSVDTTVYTPASRTVQGTSPILIAGGTSAVDLSANRVWSLAANGVTYPFLQQATALSVLGRSANSLGNLADIATTSGSNAALVENGSGTVGWGKVQNAGFRNSAANSLVGNPGGSSGSVTDIGLIGPLFFSGGNLILDYDASSLILSGGTVLERAALTGDIGCAAGSNSCTIGANAVTYAKVQQGSAHVLIGNPGGSTANLSEITLGAGLSFSGSTLVASGSGGTVTSVGATAPVTSSGGTTPLIALNIDSTLAVVSTNLGRAAISGDGSIAAGSNTFALSNIPTGTTAAGYVDFTEIAAPTAGASGHLRIWGDMTNDNVAAITHAGVKVYGAQVATTVSHQWLASFGATGAFTLTQPGFPDLSGAESCSQQVALTGDGTTSGCALTISGLALSKVTPPTGTGLAGVTASAWDAAATTVSTGLHRATGVLTADLSTGISGGQTLVGGSGSGDSLTISSTSNATKGSAIFGSTTGFVFDQAANTLRLGVATIATGVSMQINKSVNGSNGLLFTNPNTGASAYTTITLSNDLAASVSGVELVFYGNTHSSSGFVKPNSAWMELYGGTADYVDYIAQSSGDHIWVMNGTERARLTNGGSWSVAGLSAGGVTKANTSTGVLALATPGTDYSAGTAALATGPLCNTTTTGALSACTAANVAAAQTWPTAAQVLVSAGTTSAPVGDTNFTYNTSTHTLTSAGVNVLGSSTGIAALSSGTLGTATAGPGIELSGTTITGSEAMWFEVRNNASTWTGISLLLPEGGAWDIATTPFGQEYPSGAHTNATLLLNVVSNTCTGSWTATIQKNGSPTSATLTVACGFNGVVSTGSVSMGASASTDTYGLVWNTVGATIAGTSLYQSQATILLQ